MDLAARGALLGLIEAAAGHGSGRVGGGGIAVFVLVVLGYYFASEAMWGRTLAKAVFGLRVVTVANGRPSLTAIAIRTVLRLIDWLPAMYLIGFLSASSGNIAQRLGDRAAGTMVVRA